MCPGYIIWYIEINDLDIMRNQVYVYISGADIRCWVQENYTDRLNF